MGNNDVIYYSRVIRDIARAISFLSYPQNKFDGKHVFHLAFIDYHIRELDQIKEHVKYLKHVH